MTTLPEANHLAHTNATSGEDVIRKLKLVETQVRRVQNLVKQNEDWEKVIQRFAGVCKALGGTAAPLTMYLLAKEMRSSLSSEMSGSVDVTATLNHLQTLLSHRG